MIHPPVLGDLEPLQADRVGGLRFLLHSRFNAESLEQHLAVNPGLSWRHRANGQYVVGGYWRRRPDIANVAELSPGPHRRLLIEQLVASARTIGCQLVLAQVPLERHELDTYRGLDFEPIERIVEYERLGLGPPAQAGSVPLRRYHPADLPALLDLERRAFPWFWLNSTTEMAHYGESAETELWLAAPPEAGGQVVGYVGLTLRGAHGHLDRIAVDPDWRRRGIGAALLDRAVERCGRAGVRRISLTTQVDNGRAQQLYARFGFRVTRNQLTIYGRWLGRPRDRTP